MQNWLVCVGHGVDDHVRGHLRRHGHTLLVGRAIENQVQVNRRQPVRIEAIRVILVILLSWRRDIAIEQVVGRHFLLFLGVFNQWNRRSIVLSRQISLRLDNRNDFRMIDIDGVDLKMQVHRQVQTQHLRIILANLCAIIKWKRKILLPALAILIDIL